MLTVLLAFLMMAVSQASTNPANAETFAFTRNGVAYEILMPPPEYRSGPLVLDMREITVHVKTRNEVDAYCSPRIGRTEETACVTLWPAGSCMIVIDGALPTDVFDAVLIHEAAHCRGWIHGPNWREHE